MYCIARLKAARRTLSFINPDVELETHNANICEDFDLFLSRIMNGKDSMVERDQEAGQTHLQSRRLNCLGKYPVDLVLSCVDNYAARITISQACNEAGASDEAC